MTNFSKKKANKKAKIKNKLINYENNFLTAIKCWNIKRMKETNTAKRLLIKWGSIKLSMQFLII